MAQRSHRSSLLISFGRPLRRFPLLLSVCTLGPLSEYRPGAVVWSSWGPGTPAGPSPAVDLESMEDLARVDVERLTGDGRCQV